LAFFVHRSGPESETGIVIEAGVSFITIKKDADKVVDDAVSPAVTPFGVPMVDEFGDLFTLAATKPGQPSLPRHSI
jgi:hypothetical protein